MRFKLGLMLMTLSLISLAQAAEKDALPMDLIELLGELEEDDLENLDQATLDQAAQDATLYDAKTSTNKQTNGPIRSNEPRRTNEVGGQ